MGRLPRDPITAITAMKEMINAPNNWKKIIISNNQ